MSRRPGGPRDESARPEARVRAAVQSVVRGERARVGFLFDGSGIVTAAGGNPGSLDPTSFVSLVFAQFAAARALAPVATGGDLSQLVQEGGSSRCILSAIPGDRTLALLYDDVESPESAGGGWPSRAVRRTPDLAEVTDAARELAAAAPKPGPALGDGWSHAAEGEIDRIFRGED